MVGSHGGSAPTDFIPAAGLVRISQPVQEVGAGSCIAIGNNPAKPTEPSMPGHAPASRLRLAFGPQQVHKRAVELALVRMARAAPSRARPILQRGFDGSRDWARGSTSAVSGFVMASGTVKWFNGQKGYGFIQPDDGGPDVFVHISAVERAGLGTLKEGQKVGYDLERGRSGKSSAVNLRLT
jgi:cold shock protein